MQKIIKTALIGTGRLSTKRIFPYLSTAGMKVQAVCARHLEHAQEKCDLYGGKPYSNWQDMIEQENPEAVIACVGPELHYDVNRYCLERKIPVYTEKPPAANADQIQDLITMSKKSQTLCMTGFKKRYSLCYENALQWISSFPKEEWECFSLNWYAGKFDLDNNPDETVLLDFGIHAIDLVCWLFGAVERVTAYSRAWDSFAISMKFASGIVGTITLSDHRSFDFPSEDMEITVSGGNALSIHNSSSWKTLKDGVPSQWFEPATCLAGGDSGYNTGMLKELEVFADKVRQKDCSLKNLGFSLNSFKLFDAVKQSLADDGRQIIL